jgi:hypothetical protein
LRIVSLGPAIAKIRVLLVPGKMPIQMSLIGRLLARARRHLRGDRGRELADPLSRANFSATNVRYILRSMGAVPSDPASR